MSYWRVKMCILLYYLWINQAVYGSIAKSQISEVKFNKPSSMLLS